MLQVLLWLAHIQMQRIYY
jgi:hypothetical protein